MNNCNLCRLARRTIVSGRGSIPADYLLIGEAPGVSENATGIAFTGPSGRLLNIILDTVNITSFYIVNCVRCRPPENRNPFPDEVLACSRYLLETAKKVNPKKVIFIGEQAEKYYRKEWTSALRIIHPAALLRKGGVSSPYYQVVIRQLREFIDE